MKLTDLLPMYFDRSNAFETLWSFYVTVVLGLLAFSGGGKPTPKGVAVFLTIGFLVFALASLKALYDVTRQRKELHALIRKAATEDENVIAKTTKPCTLALVVAFHLFGDALAMGGIWFFADHTVGDPVVSENQICLRLLGLPLAPSSALHNVTSPRIAS